jgi:molybdate transport system substrate-binding protein
MRLPIYFLLAILLISCKQEKRKSLNIAVAANAQYAMGDILQSFEAQYDLTTEMVVSSSGKLTAQIEQGAPYDVFLSANMKYPEYLFEKGFALTTPAVYANGLLALWSFHQDSLFSLSQLTSTDIKHIAIPNPQNAPYGEAAIEVLKQSGLYEMVKDKLVYGESVGQTTQFIATGAAEVGFTALSVLLSPQLQDRGSIDTSFSHSHLPIRQGMVIMDNGNNRILKKAQSFKSFLLSGEAQEILGKWGYR